MHGARRVIAFCCLTAVLPTVLIVLPLYLRHNVFTDVVYAVAESDVIEVKEGISSIFCQKHIVRMNTTFNAYQIYGQPEISKSRKHIRLKKSIRLPDDTLEYWGFYLLKDATVALKVCSRYEGSRILVVEGSRNLKTCGLLEHNQRKLETPGYLAQGHDAVKVIFETHAQEILDEHTLNRSTTTPPPDIENLEQIAESILQRRLNRTTLKKHKRRHAKHYQRVERLKHELFREKRNIDMDINSALILDGGVEHGGNAPNYKPKKLNDESSASSFENGLLSCYDGQILLSREFKPDHNCTDVHFLLNGRHMETVHTIDHSGYYYYIFYSDNDLVSNDIHAIFDIYKPTYQYANVSEGKVCRNKTECTFSIPFWSNERVIIEVPTRDGIEHEEDDITLLVSTCQPRMSVYMIFPIAVLFLILVCAFL